MLRGHKVPIALPGTAMPSRQPAEELSTTTSPLYAVSKEMLLEGRNYRGLLVR